MSLFAGIFTSTWTASLRQLQNKLYQHISRDEKEQRHVYQDDHLYLCRVDFNSFADNSWAENENQCVNIVGHTLLSSSLSSDLRYFSTLPLNDYVSALKQAKGNFCLLNYQKKSAQLHLYCDSLAMRPYYVMEYQGAVIISSCLRLFEHLGIELNADFDAVIEIALLGFPLKDKTRYQEVKCAVPGEYLCVSGHGIQRERYFRWADQPYDCLSEAQGIQRLQEGFVESVNRYRGEDKCTFSTLSGGLDSRVIVTELLAQSCALHCFNFSTPHTQDLDYAMQFAQQFRIPFHAITVKEIQSVSVESHLGHYWLPQNYAYYEKVERPRVCWSGNGGSVCIGHVYINEDIVQACEENDPYAVADAYIDQQLARISSRLLKDAQRYQLQLRQTIVDCLLAYPHLPLLRSFQLFLWENDQHHHLAQPAENLDQYRLDFCCPFYSPDILSVMFGVSIEQTMNHRFYMKWLGHYYPHALLTPWQTYPGHEVCPLNSILSSRTQWQLSRSYTKKCKLVKLALSALLGQHRHLYHRSSLILQCILTACAIRDCSANLNLVTKIERGLLK